MTWRFPSASKISTEGRRRRHIRRSRVISRIRLLSRHGTWHGWGCWRCGTERGARLMGRYGDDPIQHLSDDTLQRDWGLVRVAGIDGALGVWNFVVGVGRSE